MGVRSSFKKKKSPSPCLWNVLVHMVWLWNHEQARVLPIGPPPCYSDWFRKGALVRPLRVNTYHLLESTRKEVFFFLLGSEAVGQKPNATGDHLFQGVRQKEDRNGWFLISSGSNWCWNNPCTCQRGDPKDFFFFFFPPPASLNWVSATGNPKSCVRNKIILLGPRTWSLNIFHK